MRVFSFFRLEILKIPFEKIILSNGTGKGGFRV
jgi:hypothetical protein